MGVKSSGTVFRVLKCLGMETGPAGAADLAKRLDVPVTTVVRALATLEAAGFAERHQRSSRYIIGKAARTLGFAFMAQFPLRDLAMPYLQQITLESGQTSSLFVRLGWYGVRIGTISGPSMLIHRAPIGEVRPLPTSAPCRVMLAFLPANEIANAGAFFDIGPSVMEQLLPEADQIRTTRSSLAPSVIDPQARDLAMPLFDHHGGIVASIAVEGIPNGMATAFESPDAVVRQIVAELASKIADGPSVSLSHYDHIDPARIHFQT